MADSSGARAGTAEVVFVASFVLKYGAVWDLFYKQLGCPGCGQRVTVSLKAVSV